LLCVASVSDAHHIFVLIDQADGRLADVFVDPGEFADVLLLSKVAASAGDESVS
jgi:hypothetical protein